MRTYGRVLNNSGQRVWVEVTTDSGGNDDYVWITTLAQNLLLVLGESPFYANNGIPAQQSVMTQIFPDFYVNQIQAQFANHFASLTITRRTLPTPTYDVHVLTNQGVKIAVSIPV